MKYSEKYSTLNLISITASLIQTMLLLITYIIVNTVVINFSYRPIVDERLARDGDRIFQSLGKGKACPYSSKLLCCCCRQCNLYCRLLQSVSKRLMKLGFAVRTCDVRLLQQFCPPRLSAEYKLRVLSFLRKPCLECYLGSTKVEG